MNEHPQVEAFVKVASIMRENRYWARNPREQASLLVALRDVMTEVCFQLDRECVLDPAGLAALPRRLKFMDFHHVQVAVLNSCFFQSWTKRFNDPLPGWTPQTILEKTKRYGQLQLAGRPRHREESVVNAGRDGNAAELPTPQVVMGKRINLLLDAAAEKRGSAVLFPEIKTELAARGVGMSRARWFYMKDGTGPLVKDEKVLTAICGMFEVAPSYLLDLDSNELPENIQARLEFVKALRVARIQAFAARTLDDVTPETLNAIAQFLNHGIPEPDAGITGVASSNTEDGPPKEP